MDSECVHHEHARTSGIRYFDLVLEALLVLNPQQAYGDILATGLQSTTTSSTGPTWHVSSKQQSSMACSSQMFSAITESIEGKAT